MLLSMMHSYCVVATTVLSYVCAAHWQIEPDSGSAQGNPAQVNAFHTLARSEESDANQFKRSTNYSSLPIRTGVALDYHAGASTQWSSADTDEEEIRIYNTKAKAANKFQKTLQEQEAAEINGHALEDNHKESDSTTLDLVTTTQAIDQVNAEGNCTWKDADKQEFVKRVFPITFLDICGSIALVVLVSMPLCCGFKRDSLIDPITHENEKAVQFAFGIGFLGVVCGLVPLIGAKIACRGLDEEICKTCVKQQGKACTPEEIAFIAGRCAAVGKGAAYVDAFGKVAAIFGFFAICLSTLVCASCFKLKRPEKFEMQAPVGAAIDQL